MSGGNTTSTTPSIESSGEAAAALSAEDSTAKLVHKRYEGLMMVRNKAIRGKGAWYWAHLEPLLVHNDSNGLPKAVKLKCCLCDTIFSASNPSRTASEHLKRGTCPNFSSTPRPIYSVSPNTNSIMPSQPMDSSPSPSLPSPLSLPNHRKRTSSGASSCVAVAAASGAAAVSSPSFQASPLAIIDPSRYCPEVGYPPSPAAVLATPTAVSAGGAVAISGGHHHPQHLVLSGGKEDLGPLAMLEDCVKRLKSPKTSPGPALSKTQIDCALNFLADWIYESCGAVSFSSIEHPKFKLFLSQVGLPGISKREICGSRLDSKYEEAKIESEARIRDAMFFQIASDGWKSRKHGLIGEDNLLNLTVNLPNGTSVYRKAVFTGGGQLPSKYAEEVLWETITDTCGSAVQQCVGIVADRFKNKALRNLENQYHWMVNLSCQYQGFNSLIKDFYRELSLFKNVAENCLKLANFVNNKSQVRNCFHKYQSQEFGHTGLIRVPVCDQEKSDFKHVYAVIEDIMSFARALQSTFLDESFKLVSMEDPDAREIEEMIRNVRFWNDLEVVSSLVNLVKEMTHKIETERPLVGQCLSLWNELKLKVRNWCAKFEFCEELIEKVIERRFKKNYHPAWAAAYILDPLHLIRDSSGKYLPPFKCLTQQQEKDVDKLITRLVLREEAHIALMELMKWRTEGLDPVYAQAVQLKQRDPITGKMRIANPQSRRLVWETYLTDFKSLGKVAVRLIFLHATSRVFKCNSSFLRWVHTLGNSRTGMDRAQKMIFMAAHSKLERRDFSNDEDKDAEFFQSANSEDDVLNDVFVDA
ncbi:hypothetical protein Nepgr_028469 [Nepenthes gracilis]|uniref:DUF7963 domain-containing protein n=1 Tax=Nepenthes gracilis TaxID=150966 RepID=A0AAD3Y4K8_NEPGR|nr:hypothetical protein Nepgr_028469 [Nepenthes gracilis]